MVYDFRVSKHVDFIRCPEDYEPLLKQVQHKVQNKTFMVQHDMTHYFMTFTKDTNKTFGGYDNGIR
jgi:hypothetical protein